MGDLHYLVESSGNFMLYFVKHPNYWVFHFKRRSAMPCTIIFSSNHLAIHLIVFPRAVRWSRDWTTWFVLIRKRVAQFQQITQPISFTHAHHERWMHFQHIQLRFFDFFSSNTTGLLFTLGLTHHRPTWVFNSHYSMGIYSRITEGFRDITPSDASEGKEEAFWRVSNHKRTSRITGSYDRTQTNPQSALGQWLLQSRFFPPPR